MDQSLAPAGWLQSVLNQNSTNRHYPSSKQVRPIRRACFATIECQAQDIANIPRSCFSRKAARSRGLSQSWYGAFSCNRPSSMPTRARRLSISVGQSHVWSYKPILTILCLALLLGSASRSLDREPRRPEQQRNSATFE